MGGRNLRRGAYYWDRRTGRLREAKARHPVPSDHPWYGPIPRLMEDFMPRETGGPSPHLSWNELACRDGTAYPAEWRAVRAARLATEFEAIRTLCGNRPLVISSAYRTISWNQRVGGAPNSQHVQGRALDIQTPIGLSQEEFWNLVYLYVRSGRSKIRGLGWYPRWLHVDTRPLTRLAVWGRPDIPGMSTSVDIAGM